MWEIESGSKLSLEEKQPHFKVGDIVIDTVNKDVGVLLRHYNLFENDYYGTDADAFIMVWDIYWAGPDDHLQTYTESGLKILYASGALILS